MLIVTTLSYDQLGAFIKDKSVELNNADLIFEENTAALKKYFTERLGSDGYVLGVRGEINPASVSILSKLDENLSKFRAIMEIDVDDDDLIVMDVSKLEEAIQVLAYGLPNEILFEKLDESVVDYTDAKELQGYKVVCCPKLVNNRNVRITTTGAPIEFKVSNITFVQL